MPVKKYNSDDFRKEDLVRCLLEFVIKDLVTTTHMSCRETDASTVFFTGGFVNHPLVRKLITEEWLALDGTMSSIELLFFKPRYLLLQHSKPDTPVHLAG